MRPTDPALADALRGQLAALESHIKTLQADNDALKQDLTAARADLAAEQARTTQAIAAFEALALKLEAIAEARRPWWRRILDSRSAAS